MSYKELILNVISDYRSSGRYYFSLKDINNDLEKLDQKINSETLKKNIARFKNENIIYSAGRGWYSFLQKKFVLNKEPVRNIINLMKREFPLLDFNVWSTEQLAPYFHHIPTRFFTFIYADKVHLQTIYEKLLIKGKKVYLDPTLKEAEKIFNVEIETIILRSKTTEASIKENYAQIETILIEFFREMIKIAILDEWEYEEIFKNIVLRQRINIAALRRYNSRLEDFAVCLLSSVIDKYCQ